MYYPQSQITTNLYSNGELSYKSTGEIYIGFYFKTSQNLYFTGATPQDGPNEELIVNNNVSSPAVETDTVVDLDLRFSTKNNYTYSLSKNVNANLIPKSPTYSPTIPTQQDYQVGEFRRYFCKKTNEIIYLEINKETYDKLVDKDPTILYQLYQPFNLPWQITGNREQVFKTNKNITELVSTKLNLPMLKEYLKNDFTKYYK